MEPLGHDVAAETETEYAVAVGDAVIYKAADGSERVALVQHVHGDDVVNLLYVDERGRAAAPASVQHVDAGGNVGWRPLGVTVELQGPSEDGADMDGVAADEAAGDADAQAEAEAQHDADQSQADADQQAQAEADAAQAEAEADQAQQFPPS